MPIVLDGAVIGTVGITGSPARVVRLGRLVQRQTEILLRESLFQRTRLLRENRLAQLARDILLFDPGLVDERIIRASGVELGYDLTQPRVAIVFEVQPGPHRYPSSVRLIGEVFGARTDIVAELSAGRYLVLHQLSPGDAEHVQERARRAADLLRDRHGIVAHVGIGEARLRRRCPRRLLRRCYGGAPARNRTCGNRHRDLRDRGLACAPTTQLGKRSSASAIHVVTVGAAIRRERLTSGLRDTLVAWCESGFNLVVTAQRLSIHRNTVIYRLDKIARTTTRNVREPGVAIALYLACLIDDATPAWPGCPPSRRAAPGPWC